MKRITVTLTEDQTRMLIDNLEYYLYHTDIQNKAEHAFMLRTLNQLKVGLM